MSRIARCTIASALLLATMGCDDRGASLDEFGEAERRAIARMSAPLEPPRDETNEVSGSERAAQFGRWLFFDRALSARSDLACASCHDPAHGFSTPERLGAGGRRTERHPPSLLNVGWSHWFDWDGKADTLWGQAARPLESPHEHGITRVEAAWRIASHQGARRAWEEVFGAPIEVDLVGSARRKERAAWTEGERREVDRVFVGVLKSLAAYEERLVARNTPFDRWARGEGEMSRAAGRGLKLFLGKARCVVCHHGPLLSDNAFHNLGLPERAWARSDDRGRAGGVTELKRDELGARGPHSADRGGRRARRARFLRATPEDLGQFKTPGLRGALATPPYMHAGQFATLAEVIDHYNELPGRAAIGHREESLRPLGLTVSERADLIAFLGALTPAPLLPSLTEPPRTP